MMERIILLVLIIGQCYRLVGSQECSSEKRCKCTKHLSGWDVNCSKLRLSKSPTFYHDVTSVNLSFNKLIDCPLKNDFYNLNHVELLDLSSNEIESLHSNETRQLFSSLSNLRTLNLSSNSIPLDHMHLTSNTFQGLHSLESIDLSFNMMTESSLNTIDDVFKGLQTLRHLSIDSVYNISFGPGFSSLTNLTSLKIQGRCHLYRLLRIETTFFEHINHIEKLDLSAEYFWPQSYSLPCSLQYIERNAISVLKNLTSLEVSFNRQLGFCGLQNVTADLSLTKIISLKANLLQCEAGISTNIFVMT